MGFKVPKVALLWTSSSHFERELLRGASGSRACMGHGRFISAAEILNRDCPTWNLAG